MIESDQPIAYGALFKTRGKSCHCLTSAHDQLENWSIGHGEAQFVSPIKAGRKDHLILGNRWVIRPFVEKVPLKENRWNEKRACWKPREIEDALSYKSLLSKKMRAWRHPQRSLFQ